MAEFNLVSEVKEYRTSIDPTNAPADILVAGSQNVLIDRNKKVKIRGGYSRLGASNTSLNPIRSAITWQNSTGGELPLRSYDDELEVYLGTVDGVDINAWTRVSDGRATDEVLRFANWWYDTETLDVILWVEGDDNVYEWNGATAVVDSVTTNTITKKGTNTWAQNRFYTTADKTVIIDGTEYTYTGGESTTTLTGVTPDPSAVSDGDKVLQKIVTHSNQPSANRNNHTIFTFENQVVLGSEDDNEVYLSHNNDVEDYAFSAPRVAGEGGLLTLEAPSQGFGVVSDSLVLFAGEDSIFKALYNEITVSTTLTESLTAEKLKTGEKQSAISPDCIFAIGNALAYMTFEPALRVLDQPNSIEGPQLRTLSNPIKPDFDSETWANVNGLWYKNAIYLSAPSSSKMYILEFVQDADGKVRRFWQPPQILPVRAFSIKDGELYGHSNSVPETYKLFDGSSDTSSSDAKLPIDAKAAYAYRDFGGKGQLKNFDEFYVEGELKLNTDLTLTLNFDFGGYTQQTELTITPDNTEILLEESVGSGLGQIPLGQNPIGGTTSTPSDAVRFNVIKEIAKEDFMKLQPIFSSNDTDKFWSVLSCGPNVVLSPRKNISIKN